MAAGAWPLGSDVYTVGEDSKYATIQEAVNAAAVKAGYIHVETTTAINITVGATPPRAGDWIRITQSYDGASDHLYEFGAEHTTAPACPGGDGPHLISLTDWAADPNTWLAGGFGAVQGDTSYGGDGTFSASCYYADGVAVFAPTPGLVVGVTYSLPADWSVAVVGAGSLDRWLHPTDSTTRSGLVYVMEGDYTEDVTLIGNTDLFGLGVVNVTGDLTIDASTTSYKVDGVAFSGTVPTNLYRMDVTGGLQFAQNTAATQTAVAGLQPLVTVDTYGNIQPRVAKALNSYPVTIFDRPMLPPRFTSAGAVVSLVFDDAQNALTTAAHADVKTALGGLTPAEYMTEKIPIIWPYIASEIDGESEMTTADVLDYIKRSGGEIGCHTYGHDTVHNNYTDPWDIADYEVRQAQGAIETEFGYPVMASYHTGSYNPGVAANALSGIFTRLYMRNHRDPAAANGPLRVFPTQQYAPTIMGAQNYTAAMATCLQYLVKFLGASQGLVWCIYSHSIQPDGTSTAGTMNVSAFKALIDALAVEYAAGRITFCPLYDLPRLYPAYAPNLILNPGFEALGDGSTSTAILMDSMTHPYITSSKGTGSSIDTITTDKHDGARCAKLVATTNACELHYNNIGVNEGEFYWLRWWQKQSAGAAGVTVKVYFAAPDGTGSNSWQTWTKTCVGSGWEQFAVGITVPKGKVIINRIALCNGNNSTNLLDDLSLSA
jgi:hypothetical protein